MPGSFPAPPNIEGKSPGNEVASSSAEAPSLASSSWTVVRGKPLKENRGEGGFTPSESPNRLCSKRCRPTSEVVSLAVFWMDARTYQGNLGEFGVVKNSMDSIFCWQYWVAQQF